MKRGIPTGSRGSRALFAQVEARCVATGATAAARRALREALRHASHLGETRTTNQPTKPSRRRHNNGAHTTTKRRARAHSGINGMGWSGARFGASVGSGTETRWD